MPKTDRCRRNRLHIEKYVLKASDAWKYFVSYFWLFWGQVIYIWAQKSHKSLKQTLHSEICPQTIQCAKICCIIVQAETRTDTSYLSRGFTRIILITLLMKGFLCEICIMCRVLIPKKKMQRKSHHLQVLRIWRCFLVVRDKQHSNHKIAHFENSAIFVHLKSSSWRTSFFKLDTL